MCPVVVVSVRPESVPTGGATRVLVGIDDAGDHVAALQFAIDTAERRGVGAHVVWATGKQSSYQQTLSLAEAMLVWRQRHPDVPMTCEAQPGRLHDVVPSAAMPGDLMVLAHHRHAPFVPDALRSSTRSVLTAVPCPVAIVHEPQRTPVDSRLIPATWLQHMPSPSQKERRGIGDGKRATDPVVR
jgi:nucleotide-binding universal stress UspA family protein